MAASFAAVEILQSIDHCWLSRTASARKSSTTSASSISRSRRSAEHEAADFGLLLDQQPLELVSSASTWLPDARRAPDRFDPERGAGEELDDAVVNVASERQAGLRGDAFLDRSRPAPSDRASSPRRGQARARDRYSRPTIPECPRASASPPRCRSASRSSSPLAEAQRCCASPRSRTVDGAAKSRPRARCLGQRTVPCDVEQECELPKAGSRTSGPARSTAGDDAAGDAQARIRLRRSRTRSATCRLPRPALPSSRAARARRIVLADQRIEIVEPDEQAGEALVDPEPDEDRARG